MKHSANTCLCSYIVHGQEETRWYAQTDFAKREQNFDQAFLEENLDDFLEDGEQPSVMETDTASQERQEVRNLGQLSVFWWEIFDSVVEDISDQVLLRLVGKFEFGQC